MHCMHCHCSMLTCVYNLRPPPTNRVVVVTQNQTAKKMLTSSQTSLKSAARKTLRHAKLVCKALPLMSTARRSRRRLAASTRNSAVKCLALRVLNALKMKGKHALYFGLYHQLMSSPPTYFWGLPSCLIVSAHSTVLPPPQTLALSCIAPS